MTPKETGPKARPVSRPGGTGDGEPAGSGEAAPELPFEQALERIEEIVEKLEGGDLTLDESLKLFQEGVELSRRCQSVLDEAQRKIELLVKAAGGALRTEPLDEEDAGAGGPDS